MDYTTLSIDSLFGRYFVNEDEREAIAQYVASLPEKDNSYFEHLVSINDVDGGAYKILSEIQNSTWFNIDEKRAILYDRDSFISSKGYIENIVEECGSPEEVTIIIGDELIKVNERVAELEGQKGKFKSLKEVKAVRATLQELNKYIQYLHALSEAYQADPGTPKPQSSTIEVDAIKTNSEELKGGLLEYGFKEFLIKKGWEHKLDNVVAMLSGKDIPFKVAFLEKIGYINFISKEYCKKSKERDIILGGILETTERRIKGNINVLNPKSKEDRNKYTAHQHEETIKDLIMGL